MSCAAKWLSRVEIALIVMGVSFLGTGFAATALRWNYQARQERALLLYGDRAHDTGVPDPIRRPGAAEPIGISRAPDLAPGNFGVDPLVLGRIEIPRVGVEAIVREGTDDATLTLAVGHIPGTARPGETGNAVLAGHRDTFFRGLRDIRLNDEVRFVVAAHSFEYRVVSTQVVAPDELSVLESRGAEELTLVTCYPFYYIGSAPSRFIVRAARVE